MKTTHTLETLDEYFHAMSNIVGTDDSYPMPAMTGKLVITEIEDGDHYVQLVGDPIYVFKKKFSELFAEISARCGCVIGNLDCVPR